MPDGDRSNQLTHHKINRLAATQLAGASLLVLIIAILGIFLDGRLRRLSERLATTEAELTALRERLASFENAGANTLIDPTNQARTRRGVRAPATDSPEETARRADDATLSDPSPQDWLARRIEALVDARTGRVVGGVESVRQFLAALPANGPAPNDVQPARAAAVTRIALSDGNCATARRWWTRATADAEADPATLDVLSVELVDCLFREDDYDAALDVLRMMTTRPSFDTRLLMLQADLEEQAGQPARAVETLTQAMAHEKLARPALSRLMSLLPDVAGTGWANELVARVEDAGGGAALFDLLVETLGEQSPADQAALADQFVSGGLESAAALRAAGQIRLGLDATSEALAAFDQCVELDETSAGCHAGRGAALLALARPVEAAEALESAVALAPDSVNAWYALAVARTNADDCAEAIEAANQVVRLNVAHANAHFVRALCQARLGKNDEAEVSLSRALALDGSLLEVAESAPAFSRVLGSRRE